jgi:hypothetical protein
MSNDRNLRPPLRIRDVVVVAVVGIVGVGSFLYHWVGSFALELPESAAESRAQMREEFKQANQEPPFRAVDIPNLSLPVVFFSSGPQDTIRNADVGHVCSIVDIDSERGYFVCLPEREALADYEWLNIRFCRHLTVMGNPKAKEIERKLRELPAFRPLAELATPLSEPQTDGAYSFSDLTSASTGESWQFGGVVTSGASGTPLSTIFRYELVTDESLGFGRFRLESLVAGGTQTFSTTLPSGLARQLKSAESCRVKIVLEIASNRKFRD